MSNKKSFGYSQDSDSAASWEIGAKREYEVLQMPRHYFWTAELPGCRAAKMVNGKGLDIPHFIAGEQNPVAEINFLVVTPEMGPEKESADFRQ